MHSCQGLNMQGRNEKNPLGFVLHRQDSSEKSVNLLTLSHATKWITGSQPKPQPIDSATA